MSYGNARLCIATIALLLPVPCMAADTGDLNIDNRCSDYLMVDQNNARCSQNVSANANDKSYISRLMYFKTSIPGNETVYCAYSIKLGKSGEFLTYAAYDRNTVTINKLCKPSGSSCVCDDTR